MERYDALAMWYDSLTQDVPYEQLHQFYKVLLNREGRHCSSLLDFCCGTGTVTQMFADEGCEMIGVDGAPEMLAEARAKAEESDCAVKPMYLCQEASELDLFGTVEGAYCCLDGMNYLPPEELAEVFRRMNLFIEPGGIFAFDMHTPEHLRELDGQTFVDETDDVMCLWRAEFDEEENALFYGMDIFSREGEMWRREEEEHVEFAHDPEMLREMLEEAGFVDVEIITDCPMAESGRIFIAAKNTR